MNYGPWKYIQGSALFCATLSLTLACQPKRTGDDANELKNVDLRLGKNAKAGVPWIPDSEKLELNKEYIEPGEAEAQKQFGEQIRALQLAYKEANQGTVKRGFHAKQLACVKGEFQVNSDLDPQLSVGIFQPGKKYQVLARFSQGLSQVNPDSKKDVKGLAIKLLDVSGPKLINEKFPNENLPQSHSLDFSMTNVPTFGTKNAKEFMEFAQAIHAGQEQKFLAFHPVVLARLVNALKHDLGDVSLESYWSGGAYRLGEKAVMKYRVAPCSEKQTATPKEPADNYYHDMVQDHLNRGEVCYKYFVQIQRDPYRQPIENPQEFWNEEETPSLPVATIRFTKGQNLAANEAVCERLTFHPWNTIEAHRPLGGVNRARLIIYHASSDQRTNHGIMLDPKG